jgi:diacylglycerol kinase family enzyme
MRIALLHNSSAGSEDHTDAELTRVLEKAGHEVAHVASRLSDLTRALQQSPCELVVVAGGDGTVGKTACELAGWQVPLTIVPLGTANNTARALRLPEEPKQLAKSWHQAERTPFDLGLMDDGTLKSRFAEAVGWGLFAETIVEAKQQPAPEDVERTLRRDRKIFRRLAEELRPRHYTIDVDGQDYSGDYLLVEVMNVGFLGPRLRLSPTSLPGDGVFELLLAGEAQRGALLDAAKSGEADPRLLPVVPMKRARVTADDGVLHSDGRLVRHAPGPRELLLEVEPGAVAYLR